jgi:hypothetical protein
MGVFVKLLHAHWGRLKSYKDTVVILGVATMMAYSDEVRELVYMIIKHSREIQLTFRNLTEITKLHNQKMKSFMNSAQQ